MNHLIFYLSIQYRIIDIYLNCPAALFYDFTKKKYDLYSGIQIHPITNHSFNFIHLMCRIKYLHKLDEKIAKKK